MRIVISVPGKIILSGEHAVVYGKPAIAAAVDRRLTVTLQTRDDGEKIINTDAGDTKLIDAAIKVVKDELKLHAIFTNGYELDIKSDIPVGAGMGSSAAVAVGVIAAFMAASSGEARLDLEKINKQAYEVEKIQHGTPSGIDNSTVTFGGFVWYRKELEFLKTFWKLQFKIADHINNFWVIHAGKPEESTKEMVNLVKQKYCKKHVTIPKVEQVHFRAGVSNFLQLLSKFEETTKQVTLALKEENEKSLMQSLRYNERLLEEVGVVGELAKKVVQEIEESGGAAKISGAGGVKDKSGLLLVYHQDKRVVEKIARKHNLEWFPAKLGTEGVRVESLTV